MIESKTELIKYLQDQFDNDSRITDTNMFADKVMTDTAIELLGAITIKYNTNETEQTIPVYKLEIALFPFCDSRNEYKFDNNLKYWERDQIYDEYREKEYQANVLPRLVEKLNDFVGDTGCYYIEKRFTRYANDTNKVMLWLCSPKISALELFDTTQDKADFILG